MRPTTIQTRQCLDCPATISAYGGRKRCAECQDKERLRQAAVQGEKRRKALMAWRDISELDPTAGEGEI